ncbi:MAG: 4-hydroxy-3-methylbut-2-enyl diphosphate reductase, partial [Victivallaceae bacterium]
FSAHGVSKTLEEAAAAKQLNLLDATCPLVKKIHHKAETLLRKKRLIILIGHRGHPETVGTLGQIDNQALVVESVADIPALPELKAGQTAAYLTQTTLSPDDTAPIVHLLKEKYPAIEGDGDICYATQNRQNAIKQLSSRCDLILVIGSTKSSNSNRLKEVAELSGTRALLIDSPTDIPTDMLNGIHNIGITAGASAPECLVAETTAWLKQLGWHNAEEIICVTENVHFPLPETHSADNIL